MTAFEPSISDQMRRNRDVLFFALNAFGWISWGSANYVGYVLNRKEYFPFLTLTIVAVTSGFLLTTALRYFCRILWRQKPIYMIGWGAVAAYALALLLRVAINVTSMRLWAGMPGMKMEPMAHWYEIFDGVLYSYYLMLSWLGLYFGFHYYEANQLERERSLRSHALAQAAQLKMLRYQLNPHFLFNTLNAISTLVLDKKNDIANTIVTRLAEFLRYTLDQDPMKTVSVTQEVAALNLYLQIEKMRFGARLTVDIAIAPDAGVAQVPSLLLQPLIENSIKYAISPSESGGRIKITAAVQSDLLHLLISDDGPGITDMTRIENGRGVGLRNIRERLIAMYGDRASVEVSNAHPGLCIALTFPARLYETAS